MLHSTQLFTQYYLKTKDNNISFNQNDVIIEIILQ